MNEATKALCRRYGKDGFRLEEDGRYFIRTIATSGRYVWHYMGYYVL